MSEMQIERLQKKLLLLEAVSVATKTMIRFAEKQNIKGLNRLARERGTALEKLVEVNAALAIQSFGGQESAQLLQRIKSKEQEIVTDNEILMEVAYTARKAVCDNMRRLQEQKKVWSAYDLQGIKFEGRRINCYK